MSCCHGLNAVLAALALILASGHHGKVACPAPGVQTWFPIADLPNGWLVHYDAPYSDATQLADVRPGTGTCILWAAKEEMTSAQFSIVAFGDRIKIEEMSPVWDNDVYWYTVDGKANGFSSLPNVDLRPGDLGPYQCFNRLSWLLDGGGGFRAGCELDLNKDTAWRKVVMYGPPADFCVGYPCPIGYYFRNDAPRFCKDLECKLDECCHSADTCRESLCSAGYYLKTILPEFCAASACQRSECCDEKPRCWYSDCLLDRGQILKRTPDLPSWCRDDACTAFECCDPAPLCAEYDCPAGWVPGNATYCASHNCTAHECCHLAGRCAAVVCGGGYTPRKVGLPDFCSGLLCTTSECCDPPPPQVYVSNAVFEDMDLDQKEIGGMLAWTPPASANDTVEYYAVYIGHSTTDPFRRFVGKAPWGATSLVIPEATKVSTNFLVYTANRGGEQVLPAVFPVKDMAYVVSNLTFQDLDLDEGELGGVVKWDFENGSNPITHYAVYLSGAGLSNESKLLGLLPSDVKTLAIPVDTALGPFSHIHVATVSPSNEQTNPKSVSIVDTVARVSRVKFTDEQDEPGLVGGKITWVPPPSTLLVTNYRVYFESTNTSDRVELNDGVPVGVNRVILPLGTEKKNFTHVCVYTVSTLAEQSTPATVPLDEKEDLALVLVMVAAGSVAGIRAVSVLAGATAAAGTAGNADMEGLEKAPSKNDQKNVMEVRVTDRYVSGDGQELVIRHMETPGVRVLMNSFFPFCVHPHHRKILVTHSGKNTVMYRHTQCKNSWFCDYMIVKMLTNNVISVHGLGDKRVRLKRKRPLCNRFMHKGSWDMVLRAFFPPAALLLMASIIIWLQETALGLILCVTTSVSVVAICLANPGSMLSNCVVTILEAPPSRFRTHFWRCVGLLTSLLPCAPAFMSNTELGWITGSVAAATALFTFVGYDRLSCLVEIAAGIYLAAMALLEHRAAATDARTAAVITAVFLSASLILIKGIDGCLHSYSSLYLNIRLPDDSLLTAAQEMADVTGVGTVRAVALEAFASGRLEVHMQENLVKALHSLAKRLVSICNNTLDRAREEMSGEAFRKAGQSIESQLKRIITIAGPNVGANAWQASQHLEELHSAMTKMKTKSFGEATIKRCRESILRVRAEVSKLEAALAVAARYLVLEATARHRVSAEVFGLYGVTTATTAEGAGMRLSGELSTVQIGRLKATVDLMQEQTTRMKKVLFGMKYAKSAPTTGEAASSSFAACEVACRGIDDALQAVQRLLRPRTPVVEGELQQNLGNSEVNAVSDWFTDVTEGGKAVDKLCQRLKDLASPEDELHMQLEPDVRDIVLQLSPQSTHKDFVEKAAFALHVMRSVAVISDRVLEEVETLLDRAERAVESLSDARVDGLRALDKLRRGRATIDKMSLSDLNQLQDEIIEVLAGSATVAAVRIHAISYLEKTGRLQDWVKEEFARIMLPLRLAAEPSSPMEPLRSIRVPPAVTGAFDDEGDTEPPPRSSGKYQTKTFLAETEEDLSGTEPAPAELVKKGRSEKPRSHAGKKPITTEVMFGVTKQTWRVHPRVEVEARPRRQTTPARGTREHDRPSRRKK